MNEYFVCLSMIVSGRHQHSSPHLSALDLLADEIQRENDCDGHKISRHVVNLFLTEKDWLTE